MEAVHQRQDGVAVRALFIGRVLSCHLDGAFVGLRAGVGKEDLLHAGSFAEHFGELGARLGVVQVGGVLHHVQLGDDRSFPGFILNAKGSYADAAGQIHIFLAVHIRHMAALAGDNLHWKALIRTGHIGIIHFHSIHNVNLP